MSQLAGETLFDAHCHLERATYGDGVGEVIQRARASGVRWLATIGSDKGLEAAQEAIALADTDDHIVATVGVHPHWASLVDDVMWVELCALAAHPKVVAIGETGLDYHYDTSPRELQQAVLRRHIALAHDLEKPLVIHVREAYPDLLRILAEEDAGTLDAVVIHCFTGTRAEAEQCLERGYTLSISGIVTFKRAGEIPEVARTVPLDRLLIETDAPFLAPIPYRGKQNEPAFLAHTAAFIAELRGMPLSDLARATRETTCRVYGLT